MLAKELLSKPDGFITATLGEEEYIIETYKKVPTHANLDDTVFNWTFILCNNGCGNIKK